VDPRASFGVDPAGEAADAGCWRACGPTPEESTTCCGSAIGHVRAADAAWRDYLDRVVHLPGCATPYEDKGLVRERAAVLVLLSGA